MRTWALLASEEALKPGLMAIRHHLATLMPATTPASRAREGGLKPGRGEGGPRF